MAETKIEGEKYDSAKLLRYIRKIVLLPAASGMLETQFTLPGLENESLPGRLLYS